MRKVTFKKLLILASANLVFLGIGTLAIKPQTAKADYTYFIVTRKSRLYNSKGHRVGHKTLKLGYEEMYSGSNKIKHSRYVRISKNRYILRSNVYIDRSDNKLIMLKNSPLYDENCNVTNYSHLKKGHYYYYVGAYTLHDEVYYKVSYKNLFVKASDAQPVSADDDNEVEVTTDHDATDFPKSRTHEEVYTFTKKKKKSKSRKKAKTYQNKLTLPKNYNVNASIGEWKKFSIKGIEMNRFRTESTADTRMKINPDKLTDSQQKEITDFAIRILNQARSQYGVPSLNYYARTQDLANRIATNYRDDNWDFADRAHYIQGICSAAQSMGLNINDNYVEDAYGISLRYYPIKNMTQLKKFTYDGLCAFLFNDVEENHARDIMSSDDTNLAMSFNTYRNNRGKAIVGHYILVPKQLNF